MPDLVWDRVAAIVSFKNPSKVTETYGFAGTTGMVMLEGQYLLPRDRPSRTLYLFMHPTTTLQLVADPSDLTPGVAADQDRIGRVGKLALELRHQLQQRLVLVGEDRAGRTHEFVDVLLRHDARRRPVDFVLGVAKCQRLDTSLERTRGGRLIFAHATHRCAVRSAAQHQARINPTEQP